MVDRLVQGGTIRSAAVEAAMRTVPRHRFVPAAPLDEAYAPDSVITRRDGAGVAISSASAPGLVAHMLEMLDVQPGERILEIGAGTGYNAALLATLTGSGGTVTTVDLDEDIVADARAHLHETGFGRIRAVAGDGTAGHAQDAPFEKAIATVGVWDLPPAWWEQLVPGGRLVVPLRIKGFTRVVAFGRGAGTWGDGGFWRGGEMFECGFMPLRGPGAVPERGISLRDSDGETVVTLRVDDGHPAVPAAFSEALAHPCPVVWTGAVVPLAEFAHLDFWLCVLPMCRVLIHGRAARARGLPEPAYNYGSMGLFDEGSFAYLTRRPGDTTDPATGLPTIELGIAAYGRRAPAIADRFAERVRAWHHDVASLAGLRLDAHPSGAPGAELADMVIDKRHVQLRIHTIPST
jgi:protein-L-isoaspartate(D-aspartate) O-methyltransferase